MKSLNLKAPVICMAISVKPEQMVCQDEQIPRMFESSHSCGPDCVVVPSWRWNIPLWLMHFMWSDIFQVGQQLDSFLIWSGLIWFSLNLCCVKPCTIWFVVLIWKPVSRGSGWKQSCATQDYKRVIGGRLRTRNKLTAVLCSCTVDWCRGMPSSFIFCSFTT